MKGFLRGGKDPIDIGFSTCHYVIVFTVPCNELVQSLFAIPTCHPPLILLPLSTSIPTS